MIETRCKIRIPARVVIALLSASGTFLIYMTRSCMSVTIVAMSKIVNEGNQINTVPFCLTTSEDNVTASIFKNAENISSQVNYWEDDKMVLTSTQKGTILGAFFYGYIMTSFIGGRLAELYGVKIVFTTGILLDGVITLLVPLAFVGHMWGLVAIRILSGLVQGVCFPALHITAAKWFPSHERSRFIASALYVNSLSMAVTFPLTGVITESLGWRAVFYIFGAASVIFVFCLKIFMYNEPLDDPTISQMELNYIMNCHQNTTSHKPKKIPWKSMLTSTPLWAYFITHAGNVFCMIVLMTQLPTYLSSVIGFSLKQSGLYSALPFLARFFACLIWACLSDALLKKEWIRKSYSRKLFELIGLLGPAIFTCTVGFLGCNSVLIVTAFVLSLTFNAAVTGGHLVSLMDMAPNLAGTCFGIANTFAFAASFLAPIIVGALTPTGAMEEWRIAFLLVAAIYLICLVAFTFFSSVTIQPWNAEIDQAQNRESDSNAKEGYSSFREGVEMLNRRR